MPHLHVHLANYQVRHPKERGMGGRHGATEFSSADRKGRHSAGLPVQPKAPEYGIR